MHSGALPGRSLTRFLSTPSLLLAGLSMVVTGCGSEETQPPAQWPDGALVDSAPGDTLVLDGRANDLGALPDIEVDTEGPTIEIIAPKEEEVVIGQLVKVRAMITDADGIDDQTVTVTPAGRDAVRMSVTATSGIYEGLIDIASFGENVRVWVTAGDLLGKSNTAFRDFKRDAGPLIQVNSPAADSRHKNSVSLQVIVADKYRVTSFEARIGSVVLELKKTDLGQGRTMYVGSVKFDDPVFNPPLSGQQVITFNAANENGAKSNVERIFFVDDEGPELSVSSQSPGQLIGGIIQIAVNVSDPAGVVDSSVTCVIGNELDKRLVPLKSAGGASYIGQFDTRTLTPFDLWPVMSFRAADTLGNESHFEFQVGLDNGTPAISLDPSAEYYWGVEGEVGEGDEIQKALLCSKPFDPVGEDAASDLELVPQVQAFRVRIEDRGNHLPTAPWRPVSAIDPGSPRIFLLDDTAQAVVVDSTGDGYCDSINPEVEPLGTAPAPGQAVAVNLVPIPPSGTADFTPYTATGNQFPFAQCNDGEAEESPEPLCKTTVMTKVIPWTAIDPKSTEPAIYSIPPVATGKQCVGLPFDFLANNFDDGWVCVAVEAADNLGNASVSRPLRVWVKKDELVAGPLPDNAGTPPNCTGTIDATTGTVDSSKPCAFRQIGEMFPQVFHPAELVIEK